MTGDTMTPRGSILRRLLCLAPPARRWFAEIDQMASDARSWRARQSGSAADQQAVLELMACLAPVRAVGVDKVRIGGLGDGGYVMLDDFAGVCGALSLGIGPDCSWDIAIAERGIDVHQYDHSVAGPPEPHARFRFFPTAIGGQSGAGCATLGDTVAKLPPAVDGRLVLKIDIEGAEWDALDAATADDLSRFSQIVGEFHGFADVLDAHWRQRAERVLGKILAGFALVHVHANNYGAFDVVANVAVADIVELSFASRAMYRFEATDEVFPTALDRPNLKEKPDIILGAMRFR
ncbi:MAG: FkbM family methyltransferase [Acetobacteraceae bacterium]|nr:FkbM family methyltransferase [Acetobacteraceae bacterium]